MSDKKKIDWDKLRERMPTDRTDEQKKKRFEMFARCDPNGNGYLSLAEVDKGLRDILELKEIFDVKPVIMRAFQAAKGASKAKNKANKHGDDYVEKREFRLLLVYLRQYFEIWQMFDRVDTGDDCRVDLDEFKKAKEQLEKWGHKIDDAEAEFKKIDKNGGGKILFEEFAEFALSKTLDLEDDDEGELEGQSPAKATGGSGVNAVKAINEEKANEEYKKWAEEHLKEEENGKKTFSVADIIAKAASAPEMPVRDFIRALVKKEEEEKKEEKKDEEKK